VEVWPVDSLEKIFPDDAVGTHALGEKLWRVPRNGHVNLQIALRSSRPVSGLRVMVSEPRLNGVRLPVRVRRAGYVPVGSNPANMPPEELVRAAPAWFPDPLLEDFPFDLAAGETHALWLTVECPAGVRAGDYQGEAQLLAGGRRVAAQAFTVRVTSAEVPREQTLAVTNWLNLDEHHLQNSLSGARQRSGPVLASARKHRAGHGGLSAEHAADAGEHAGRCDGEWRRHPLSLRAAGPVGGGVREGRVAGHHRGRAPAWPRIRLPDRTGGSVAGGGGGRGGVEIARAGHPRAAAYLRGFLSALYAHLREKGWTGRYIQHIHDEPHGPELAAYSRYSRLIRSELPGIPTIDAIDINENLAALDEATDIWVMILGSFDHRMDAVEAHLKRGGKAWFYTCVAPQGRYLNRFIDQPLLKTRLLHWLNFATAWLGICTGAATTGGRDRLRTSNS